MAATDGQIILAASRFGGSDSIAIYLKDFVKQPLPAVAKIVKGQYQNLGVPTLSNPSLQSTALFLTAGKRYQIIAQPIKIKEGRRPTNVGPKVLIPETYPGYFELLSEDGRSTRCIDSVLELSKRRNLRVLVRETFRCNHLNRTIHAGEILITIGDNGKYLQCKTIKDEIINLPLEAKAKFSPIAKEDSISGVHSAKNLLLKRMPVVVRLVYGNSPKGLKQPFIPELRLLGCVETDRVFALPLQKDTDLIPVPLNSKIKLERAKNMDQLENFIEYSRFLEKAQRLLIDARDHLQVVDLKFSEKEKKESKSNSRKMPLALTGLSGNVAREVGAEGILENGYILRKSASIDGSSLSDKHNRHNHVTSLTVIADEYDEIDHIYDYVRGLTPLSKGLNRFESICESTTTTIKSQPDSGNYSSLIRVSSSSSNNLYNNGNNTGNNASSSGSNRQISNGINNASKCSIGNNNSANNNYSSLESTTNNKKVTVHHSSYHHPHQHHHHHHHHHNNLTQQQQQPQLQPHLQTQYSHYHNHPSQSLQNIPHISTQTPYFNYGPIREDIKPMPPPIETIPGKKLPEKRQRPTLPKLYVKNSSSSSHNNNQSSSNTSHQHHHQSSITSKNVTNGNIVVANGNSPIAISSKESVEPQSPLFHIRYKSLSSLQLTPDSNCTTPVLIAPGKCQEVKINKLVKSSSTGAGGDSGFVSNGGCPGIISSGKGGVAASGSGGLGGNGVIVGNNGNIPNGTPGEGTLDSSRSGGRTSGDSKLPEKKTRRLSRPRSLSNLVWDFRPSKEKSKKKLYIHHFDHRQQGTLYL